VTDELTALRRLADLVSRGVGRAAVLDAIAEAGADLHRIAAEQAALRRVAEHVAHGTGQTQLFEAVTAEAAALIGDATTTLARFVGGRAFTVLAAHHGAAAVGSTVEVPADDAGVVAEVLRTGRPARRDEHGEDGERSPTMANAGVASGVAVPVVVDDRMWGLLSVVATGHLLPTGTEQRLQRFAELVAAAVANRQARAKAEQLANQQAALRRVAELAAKGVPAEQVLGAVAAEASALAGVTFTTVLRYERDGSTEIMALSGSPSGLAPGMRAAADGDGAVQRVWWTRRPAHIDDLGAMSGQWPRIAHGSGFSSSAAVPIVIRGDLWGVLVAVGREEPIRAAVRDDLAGFADLAGTVIAATQARQELRALADEQVALRRIADLVAHGADLDEVFGAVTTEASKLLGGLPAALQRHEGDESATTVAACGVGAAATVRATIDLAVPVNVEGRVWGTLTVDATASAIPAGTEERLQQFAELAAAAIANAENKAQLKASRARVVATADETRRRLQRDVHDGAQQRLVQTIITLKLARNTLARGGAAGDQISEALYHAERANTELRALVHGILPASLTQGGLRTGLESLIDDISIPVTLRLNAPPLPTEIETNAYFIVAEALTNVVKHAHATHADVTVELTGGTLSIGVGDDGTGGADPAKGSGLTGLSDRAGAAEGTFTLTSTAGRGTTVHVSLPVPVRRP
jgi:signal transduction histidine kinase/23S rRNA pseudoU1915 N3-methylase RlmH